MIPPESGVSRRELLQRAAVVGGSLVWLAPAIQSFAPRAYADVSPGVSTCCQCVNDGAGGGGSQYECVANSPTVDSPEACDAYCTTFTESGSTYLMEDFHQDFPTGGPSFSCVAASPSGTRCSPVPH